MTETRRAMLRATLPEIATIGRESVRYYGARAYWTQAERCGWRLEDLTDLDLWCFIVAEVAELGALLKASRS